MLGIALISISIVLLISHFAIKSFFHENTSQTLEQYSTLLRDQVEDDLAQQNYEKVRHKASTFSKSLKHRYTIIDKNGAVIYDNRKDYRSMENHKDRREVRAALQGKMGKSQRESRTFGEEFTYTAIPVKNGPIIIGAIRGSMATVDLKKILNTYYFQVMWFLVIFIFLLIFVNWYVSQKISRPLEIMTNQAESFSEGDLFDVSFAVSSSSVEVLALAHSLYKMSKKIKKQFKKIANQKEEREVVFASMIEGVLSIDMKGKIFHWNKATCKLFDVNQTEGLKGHPFENHFTNLELKEIYEEIKETHKIQERELVLANNRVIQVHGSLLSSPVKPQLGVLFVFNDITKLRELEMHRKEFVANVSHELRTPLTAMQGFLETLLEHDIDSRERRDKFLKIIQKHTSRLSQIIEDLLALSNFDREKDDTSIVFEVQELKPVILNTIQLNETKAHRKNIQLQLDYQDVEPLKARINAHLLEQAVSNLVDNAIKYSPSKTTVTITCRKNAQNLEISIQDQGMGIPAVHLPRLFERFYSVDKARSREMGGSGLGLSIVKHISAIHSGDVSVESELEKGTKFTITIPADNPKQLPASNESKTADNSGKTLH